MSRIDNFELIEIDGKEIWVYGKPGRAEARAVTPGKYGKGDWKGSMLAESATCEIAPTMPALLVVTAAILVSQRIQPADTIFNLDFAGYLEKMTTVESMEQGILVAHECHLNWEHHRKHHGRS